MDVTDEISALNIGQKIKTLRQRKELTLKDVSERTGLSKPLLSQIENNLTAPPIATLLKISNALEVTIGHFFQERVSSERISVVRAGDRATAIRRRRNLGDNRVGYRYEALAGSMSDKNMEPFLVDIDPRNPEDMIFYQHRGEEFLFVLEGRLEFRGGDQVIILDIADSIYFDSSIAHALRGLDQCPAKAIGVIYAPE
jgi:transcriptional regulator with XRE-family HTH domain